MNGLDPINGETHKRLHAPEAKEEGKRSKLTPRFDALAKRFAEMQTLIATHQHPQSTPCTCNEDELQREIRVLEAEHSELKKKLKAAAAVKQVATAHPVFQAPPSSAKGHLFSELGGSLRGIAQTVADIDNRITRLENSVTGGELPPVLQQGAHPLADRLKNLFRDIYEEITLIAKLSAKLSRTTWLGELGPGQWKQYARNIHWISENYKNLCTHKKHLHTFTPDLAKDYNFWVSFLEIFCNFPHYGLPADRLSFIQLSASQKEASSSDFRLIVYRIINLFDKGLQVRDHFLTSCFIWKMMNPSMPIQTTPLFPLIQNYPKTSNFLISFDKGDGTDPNQSCLFAPLPFFTIGLSPNSQGINSQIPSKDKIFFCPDSTGFAGEPSRDDEKLEHLIDDMQRSALRLIASESNLERYGQRLLAKQTVEALFQGISNYADKKKTKLSSPLNLLSNSYDVALIHIIGADNEWTAIQDRYQITVATPLIPLTTALQGMLKDTIKSYVDHSRYVQIVIEAIRQRIPRQYLSGELKSLIDDPAGQQLLNHLMTLPITFQMARIGVEPIVKTTSLQKLFLFFDRIFEKGQFSEMAVCKIFYDICCHLCEEKKIEPQLPGGCVVAAMQSSSLFDADIPSNDLNPLFPTTPPSHPQEEQPAQPAIETVPNIFPLEVIGLPNIGNSSYINASIQALFSSFSFSSALAGFIPASIADLALVSELKTLKYEPGIDLNHAMKAIRDILFDNQMHPQLQVKDRQTDPEAVIATMMNACGYQNKLRETKMGLHQMELLTEFSESLQSIFHLTAPANSSEQISLLHLLSGMIDEPSNDPAKTWHYVMGTNTTLIQTYQIHRQFIDKIPPLIVMKINRMASGTAVEVSDWVDLSSMMDPSLLGEEKAIYQLVSCVNFIETDVPAGRYLSYGLRQGEWHRFEDEVVKKVEPAEVDKEHASFLIYERQIES